MVMEASKIEILKPIESPISATLKFAGRALKYGIDQLKGGAWADLAEQVKSANITYYETPEAEPEIPYYGD